MTTAAAATTTTATVAGESSDGKTASRRPNPLNIAYDRKRADIEESIAKLQAKLEALKTGDDGSVSSAKGERGRVISELKRLREKTRLLRDDAGNDVKSLKEVQSQIKRQKDDVKDQKDKLPFKSVADVVARINLLEQRIESGSFALIEEKQVLQDISKLKKTKRMLEVLEAGGSIDGRSGASDIGALKMKEEVLRNRATTKYAEVDDVKKQIEALEQDLVKLDGGKEAALQKQKLRQAEMDKLRKSIDELYDSKRKLQDEHREAKQKQKETWERNKARREEDDKRRQLEDQIHELEQKLQHLNPTRSLDDKLDECVNLHNYFSGLLGKEEAGRKTEEEQSAPADHKPIVDGEFVALKPKSDRQEIFMQLGSSAAPKSKKQSSSASGTPSQAQLNKLPIQILAALADLQLSVPGKTSQVPDLLRTLADKKTGFEKKRKEALEGVQAEESALKSQIAALHAQCQ